MKTYVSTTPEAPQDLALDAFLAGSTCDPAASTAGAVPTGVPGRAQLRAAYRRTRDQHEAGPGASAQREYNRRVDSWKAGVRAKRPVTGRFVRAKAAPREVAVWAQGAEGERATARVLSRHTGRSVVLLHDRKVPGTDANIDHIAITRHGVYVIDTKNYRAAPTLGRAGELLVAGSDVTHLADGVAWQVQIVSEVLTRLGTGPLPVLGALAFTNARRGKRHVFHCRHTLVAAPRTVAALLRERGNLSARQIADTAAVLQQALPEA